MSLDPIANQLPLWIERPEVQARDEAVMQVRSDCFKQLWRTTEEDREEGATTSCKQ